MKKIDCDICEKKNLDWYAKSRVNHNRVNTGNLTGFLALCRLCYFIYGYEYQGNLAQYYRYTKSNGVIKGYYENVKG